MQDFVINESHFHIQLDGTFVTYGFGLFSKRLLLNTNSSILLLIKDLYENCSYHWSCRPK